MKKIKSFILAMLAFALVAPTFTSCKKDDESNNNTNNAQIVQNIMSEFTVNDQMVASQKAASGKNVAVLLVAFGSTWNNAFLAFDETKKAYERAFPEADVYVSFSSDICINRASVGENTDDNGNIVKRDYYEPRYLLHAIGAAKYDKIYVQSLQVIPGEEFAAVVASVKKFMNNGYIASAHLDDAYLAKLAEEEAIFLGMPLLSDSTADVTRVARELNNLYASEAQQGVVAFMGHGNPDKYVTDPSGVPIGVDADGDGQVDPYDIDGDGTPDAFITDPTKGGPGWDTDGDGLVDLPVLPDPVTGQYPTYPNIPGGLGNATNGIPNLASPGIELGTSVNLDWQEGLILTPNI